MSSQTTSSDGILQPTNKIVIQSSDDTENEADEIDLDEPRETKSRGSAKVYIPHALYKNRETVDEILKTRVVNRLIFNQC